MAGRAGQGELHQLLCSLFLRVIVFVQIKRDQVVSVLGELITGHTEFASIITDVVASKVPIIKFCRNF